MKQQIDPIAQAMQILQFVTQRRGQQADIEQGGRRLDLQEQQLQQGGEQFNQGLQWEQENAQMKNKQFAQGMLLREIAQKQSAERWQAEQAQKLVQQALEQSRFAQTQPTDQAYKQIWIDKARREMSGQIQDPQMIQAQLDQDRMIVATLQEQLNLAPQMEQGRLRDQIQAYLAQRYKDKLPPLRDYNQAELNAQQMFQIPQQ